MVVNNRFREVPGRHDAGPKTFLGRTGEWRTPDLVRILLDHPATAERLATKLCSFLMGEGAMDPAALQGLAAGLREHNLDVGWAVATVLRSEAFFAEANIGTQVLEPVAFLVGPVRAFELFDDPPSTIALADWAARLGQDLFYPPNVGGWPGGRAWITTRADILRELRCRVSRRQAVQPRPGT